MTIVRVLQDTHIDVVGESGDARDLVLQVTDLQPDVAVVDIRMPPTNTDDGLRAALEIRQHQPGTGVLILSQYVEEGYAVELISDPQAAWATCSRTGWPTSDAS